MIQGYDAVEVLALTEKSDLLATKETLDTFDLQRLGYNRNVGNSGRRKITDKSFKL